ALGREHLAAVDRQLNGLLMWTWHRFSVNGQRTLGPATRWASGLAESGGARVIQLLVGDAERDHVLQGGRAGTFPGGLDLGLELVTELGHHRADRHRHRVSEHAQ